MPKTNKPAAPARKTAAKSAARNTDSGPSRIDPAAPDDIPARQKFETEQLAAGMDNSANKAAEHGFANGVQPLAGATVTPASRLPLASTLTEAFGTEKTGSMAPEGVNSTIEPLDRVRVDSAGQVLTTNQGVPIADNQNSLKYGVRGPALLEDFILREKITHFDHERIPERIVHARGSGAHGFFECYEPQTKYT
ncbi:MAG TPA: catalase, partial [Ramlibacter sp.]